jgi:uncharacterized membrane protein YraQ (UPF0718 family)
MIVLISVTIVFLVVSFLLDRRRTFHGVRKGLNMFVNLLPVILTMLAVVSIVLFLLPQETLVKYMGTGAGVAGWLTAALLGSVALIPGFIAYPLCGILIKQGVSYSVISVFITTLMMVGFITLPVEAKFFGMKVSLVRNGLSFIAALLIGFLMSFVL